MFNLELRLSDFFIQIFLDSKEIKTIDAMNIEEAYIDYNFLDEQHVLDLQPSSEVRLGLNSFT